MLLAAVLPLAAWKLPGLFFGEHPLILLVPETHSLAQSDKAKLCMLEGENFIVFSPDGQLRKFTDRIFQTLDIHPNVKAETAQDSIINGLVAAGHGIAIVPYPLSGAPYHTKLYQLWMNSHPDGFILRGIEINAYLHQQNFLRFYFAKWIDFFTVF